jgi:hypothetical protein
MARRDVLPTAPHNTAADERAHRWLRRLLRRGEQADEQRQGKTPTCQPKESAHGERA